MEYKFRVGRHEAMVRENLLDRAIRWVDPVRGQQRLAARAGQAAMAAVAGGYTGGRRDKRSLSSFQPKGTSADAALLPDLPTLRERSRDLVRNEPLASGALSTLATNVIGTGLMLKSRVRREVLGWTEEQAAAWQSATEYEFCLWAESTFCDVTRTQNFYGLQDLAVRSSFENGDAFALLPFLPRASFPYQLAVQLIEADRVCNKDAARDTPALAGGVQLTAGGAPVAYHVLNQHPGDLLVGKRDWKVYQAFGSSTGRRNMLHLYRRKRIGQTRGVPWFAPVIEPFRGLGTYKDAEIQAAVLSSMIAIVTKTKDRGGLNPLDSAVVGTTPTSGAADTAAGSGWDGTLTPGLSVDLGIDEEVSTFAGSGRPNPQFDPFVMSILMQVGAALEIPVEVLTKRFLSSYSAARSALLEAWRMYRTTRVWMADAFCQPVYEAWMEEAVALGRVPAPGFFDDALLRAAYLGSQWHGDGPGAIDPLKEVQAARERVLMHLTTLDDEIAGYSGSDAATVLEQAGREKKLLEKNGLAALLPAGAAPGAQGDGDGDADGDGDGDGKGDGDDKGADKAREVNVFVTVPSQVTHQVNHLPVKVDGLEAATSAMAAAAGAMHKQAGAAEGVTAAVRESTARTAQAVQGAVAAVAQQGAAVIRAVQDTGAASREELRAVAVAAREVAAEVAKPRAAVTDKDGVVIGSVAVESLDAVHEKDKVN